MSRVSLSASDVPFDVEFCLASIRRTLRLQGLDLKVYGDFMRTASGAIERDQRDGGKVLFHVFVGPTGNLADSPSFYQRWDPTQGPPLPEVELGIFLAGMAAGVLEQKRGEESPAHMTFVSQRLPGTDPLTYVPVYVPELGNMHVGHVAQIDSGLPVAHSLRCRFCHENGGGYIASSADDFERHLTDTHGLRPKGGLPHA